MKPCQCILPSLYGEKICENCCRNEEPKPDVVGSGWVGVDLDGTLAHYDRWRGEDNIGDPVPLMLQRVKDHLAKGDRVKIFTARVCNGARQIEIIQDWCEKHGLPRLEVTNVKDFSMWMLYDDRCRQVEANTGILVKRS